MSNTPAPSLSEIQSRLHQVAGLLHGSSTIDEESRRVLAELVDELSSLLQQTTVPAGEVTRLADSTTHLADALHHQQDVGILEKARERLEGTVLDAETHAPIAVGLARRLLDALANIGI